MAISDLDIIGWIGITNDRKKQAVVDTFMPRGLGSICSRTEKKIENMAHKFAKRSDGAFPILLSEEQEQMLWSIVLWARDRRRAGQVIEFKDGTTEAQFQTMIDDALLREERRKEKKKVGEAYLDATFNTQLKGRAQWENFEDELKETLEMILGVDGIPLSYVIRENDAPEFDENINFDEAVIKAAKLEGENFKEDALTVHKLIKKNVAEDSDAFVYIKGLIKYRNGRRDIKGLRDRFANEATKQVLINEAKATLATLRYKSEKSFSFEKFSAKLKKAYDDLEANGRKVHNGDIVDGLWAKIQDGDLQTFIDALQIDYAKTPVDYKEILQSIATKVAAQRSTAPSGGRYVSAVTRAGDCPASGAHTKDGSLYIGNYTAEKWKSDSVRPHHREILQARSQEDGGGKNESKEHVGKRGAKAIKRNKKKLKSLQKKIAAAKVNLAKDESDDKDKDTPETNAGDAFGGKKSKST